MSVQEAIEQTLFAMSKENVSSRLLEKISHFLVPPRNAEHQLYRELLPRVTRRFLHFSAFRYQLITVVRRF